MLTHIFKAVQPPEYNGWWVVRNQHGRPLEIADNPPWEPLFRSKADAEAAVAAYPAFDRTKVAEKLLAQSTATVAQTQPQTTSGWGFIPFIGFGISFDI